MNTTTAAKLPRVQGINDPYRNSIFLGVCGRSMAGMLLAKNCMTVSCRMVLHMADNPVLDRSRRNRWIQMIEGLNFQHSSRSLLRKLGGNSHRPQRVKPDQIGNGIVNCSIAKSDTNHTKQIEKELSNLKKDFYR